MPPERVTFTGTVSGTNAGILTCTGALEDTALTGTCLDGDGAEYPLAAVLQGVEPIERFCGRCPSTVARPRRRRVWR